MFLEASLWHCRCNCVLVVTSWWNMQTPTFFSFFCFFLQASGCTSRPVQRAALQFARVRTWPRAIAVHGLVKWPCQTGIQVNGDESSSIFLVADFTGSTYHRIHISYTIRGHGLYTHIYIHITCIITCIISCIITCFYENVSLISFNRSLSIWFPHYQSLCSQYAKARSAGAGGFGTQLPQSMWGEETLFKVNRFCIIQLSNASSAPQLCKVLGTCCSTKASHDAGEGWLRQPGIAKDAAGKRLCYHIMPLAF